jgi:subtilisin family serine protease
MRSAKQRLPTILHLASWSKHCLPATIALATVLMAMPAAEAASAMSLGRGFQGGIGNQSRNNFGRNNLNTQKTFRQAPTTRLDSPGNRVVGRQGKGVKKGEGGKVADGSRRRIDERNPRRPRPPRLPIRQTVVGIPAGIGVVTDTAGGGVPPRLTGPSGTGGGAGPYNQVVRRNGSGVPPAGERRYVPDEVVLELAAGISEPAAAAVARRHRLVRLESLNFQIGGTTLVRWRIPDRRAVPVVVRALETDGVVLSAQPNYLALLQQEPAAPQTVGVGVGDPMQYALAKLQLPQAHALALGDKVLIAVVDSGIDAAHPELAGMIIDQYDAIGFGDKVHPHGTGIAGAIVAHARLKGTAPAAQILAARAFGSKRSSSDGTSFNILKALDWSVRRGARIINMSFAGPRDPAVLRSLAVAHAQGIILVAAAGNAGPKSPPLYPAADPDVIAVTATDESDQLFHAANQGTHIAVAAPGVDIFLPAPEGTYQMISGTSFAAAEVSGTVALMLERRPDLDPQSVRKILMTTARDLGPTGLDTQFGAGLVDAYQAVLSTVPRTAEPQTTGAAVTAIPVSTGE